MPNYAKLRASAYKTIKKAGARVTFTGITTVVDHTTGASTKSESTILGYAIAGRGFVGESRRVYEELRLVVKDGRVLLVAPDAGSSMPTLDMTVLWEAVRYTVRYVENIAPGGTLILGWVVVSA